MAQMKQFLLALWEVFEVVIVALISYFVITIFIAQPFQVSGPSMEPNFYNKQYLIVDEISYRFRAPERGEVIVFHNPENEKEFFIKRVIGLPGDEVLIKDGKVVIVNDANPKGFTLDESYLPSSIVMSTDSSSPKLGEDEYFVMGDNRIVSFDSRSWGPVKKSEIVGAVRVRLWPPEIFSYAHSK